MALILTPAAKDVDLNLLEDVDQERVDLWQEANGEDERKKQQKT